MAERAKWFRNLERRHQQEISLLHAAQRGEVFIGIEGKAINSAIRAARKDLRYYRRLAVMSGDVQPYPKVDQMRKPAQVAEEIIRSHARSNGHHKEEDLTEYTSATSGTGTKVLATTLS